MDGACFIFWMVWTSCNPHVPLTEQHPVLGALPTWTLPRATQCKLPPKNTTPQCINAEFDNEQTASSTVNYPAFVISDLVFRLITKGGLSPSHCLLDVARTLLVHYWWRWAEAPRGFGENTTNAFPKRAAPPPRHVQMAWVLSQFTRTGWGDKRKGHRNHCPAGANITWKKKKKQHTHLCWQNANLILICSWLFARLYLQLFLRAYLINSYLLSSPTWFLCYPFTTRSSSWENDCVDCLSKPAEVTGCHRRGTGWKNPSAVPGWPAPHTWTYTVHKPFGPPLCLQFK